MQLPWISFLNFLFFSESVTKGNLNVVNNLHFTYPDFFSEGYGNYLRQL